MFIMICQVVLALSILVTIHEFGHFIAARAFGIRVEKFYLFFDAWNFKLFSFKRGDTEYGIGWLPLGGYVKIAGMIDESLDTEALKLPPQPWEFRAKPAWQRLIVMIGGVVMNILLGIIIFSLMTYANGEKNLRNDSLKYGILPSKLAEETGFKKGDKIVSVNGNPIKYFNDVFNPDYLFEKGSIYKVERDSHFVDVKLPDDFIGKLSGETKGDFFRARLKEFYIDSVIAASNAEKGGLKKNDVIIAVDNTPFTYFDEFQELLLKRENKTVPFKVIRSNDTITKNVLVDDNGKIGFVQGSNYFVYDTVRYSFLQSIPVGFGKAMTTFALQITGWKHIFSGDVAVDKAIQGPVGIARFFGSTWDWDNFWFWTGLISLGLAFMNMLPIPALDGGHVVILTIEAITKRKLSDKIMERVQMVGMIILLSLMVLVIGNDIFKLFQ